MILVQLQQMERSDRINNRKNSRWKEQEREQKKETAQRHSTLKISAVFGIAIIHLSVIDNLKLRKFPPPARQKIQAACDEKIA